MSKTLKNFVERIAEAFAGATIAVVVFFFCKVLLVHHNLHLPNRLLIGLVIYASLYSLLFALLHVGGRPSLGSTIFTAFLMVIVSCLITYADDRFASFTVWAAFAQFAFASTLSASTFLYVYINRTPLALGKS